MEKEKKKKTMKVSPSYTFTPTKCQAKYDLKAVDFFKVILL